VLLFIAYLGLLKFGSGLPERELEDPDAPIMQLPESGPTVKVGLHYLLRVVVLVWAPMVERLSPGLSAFWATGLMVFILLTQRPIIALFRSRPLAGTWIQGRNELIDGLIDGARNMIGIGIATATAGVIVGSVTLTGIGAVMTDVVELISGGNIMLMLIFAAVISLVLGMGLPPTANCIVVFALMAPVIVELGAESGLLVPLVASTCSPSVSASWRTLRHRSAPPPLPRLRCREGIRSAPASLRSSTACGRRCCRFCSSSTPSGC
jgi:TRAP-type uncharacterized transport system fused permease subunit